MTRSPTIVCILLWLYRSAYGKRFGKEDAYNTRQRSVIGSRSSSSASSLEASPRLGPPVVNLTAPPMGFRSWERFRCQTDCTHHATECVHEDIYKEIADVMVDQGYLQAGYRSVHIDDCWSDGRDIYSTRRLRPDPLRFPSGLKALGDYLHEKGLQFGLYSDLGPKTCQGYEGSEGYEALDALTFAQWGVDHLKMDGCGIDKDRLAEAYTNFGSVLKDTQDRNTANEFVYSCSWPAYIDHGADETNQPPFDEMYNQAGCNTWRNWHDVDNIWNSVRSIIYYWANNSEALAKIPPNSFNDADMLIVGDDHYGHLLSLDQARLQFGFWSMIGSPLMIGGDMRTIPPSYRKILLNRNVIAVNQDPFQRPAKCEFGCSKGASLESQFWSRSIDGADVLVFLNLADDVPAGFLMDWTHVGHHVIRCVDLWDDETAETNLCPRDGRAPNSTKWGFDWDIDDETHWALNIHANDVPPNSHYMLRLDLDTNRNTGDFFNEALADSSS